MILCLAGICLFAGYFWGDYSKENEIVETVVTEQVPSVIEQPSKLKYSGTIAIVNLDEGIIQGDTILNYGNSLISAITADIRVTGLQDARNGIETGQYCAYLVIPTTFSANVLTINEKPVTSELTYAVAPGIEGQERDTAIYNIYAIYHSFSNNISQIYTATILDEYHDAQDAASRIMMNDTQDMNALMEIQPYDLVEAVPIPQLERMESEVTKLVLEENFAANVDAVNQIDTAYKTYLANGEEGFLNIRNQTSDISVKVEEVGRSVDSVNTVLNTYIDEEQVKKEQLELNDEKERLLYEDKVAQLKTEIQKHNELLSDFNKSVEEKVSEYQYIETKYRDLAKDLSQMAVGQEMVTVEIGEEIVDATQYIFEFYTKEQLDKYKESAIDTVYDVVVTEMTSLNDKLIDKGGESILNKNQTMEEYVASFMGISEKPTEPEKPTDPEKPTEPEETTEESTETPTDETTESSTEETIEEITGISTEGSTEGITEPSTEGSTEGTTEPSTEGSTEETTEPSTEGSTEETTEPSTEDSTEGPTEPPTEGGDNPDTPEKPDDTVKPVAFKMDVLDDLVEEPSIEIDGVAITQMTKLNEESANEVLKELVSMAVDNSSAKSRELVDSINNNEEMKSSLEKTIDAYSDVKQEQLKLEQDVFEYKLVSFINDSEISGIVAVLNSNVSEIESKVRTHDLDYDTYTKAVYELTEKNIAVLKENIAEAQKASALKVSEGLESAKNSRTASNEENIILLKTLTNRLAYTRLGNVENKEVYSFMAKPVTLYNISTETGAAKKEKEEVQTVKVTTTVKEQQKENVPPLLIIAGAAGLLMIAGVLSVAFSRRKTNDEF